MIDHVAEDPVYAHHHTPHLWVSELYECWEQSVTVPRLREMETFFEKLKRGSDFLVAEDREGGFVIRPKPGFQKDFDRLAELTIKKAGKQFAVLPQTNGQIGWTSLELIPLN